MQPLLEEGELMGESRGSKMPAIMGGRTLIFLLSAILSSLTGFIIVRKLDPVSYAAYQSFTKRVIQYIAMTTVFYEIWLYRDFIRRVSGFRKTVKLYAIIAGIVGGSSGFLLVYWISQDVIAGMLALLAGSILGVRSPYMLALDAVRPLRAPTIRVIQRSLYFLLAILLILYLKLGLNGALLSFLAGVSAGFVLTLRWLAEHPSWVEHEKGGRSFSLLKLRLKASIARMFSYFIPNVDVPLAYYITGNPLLISAFFAARLIPFTLLDIVRNMFRYIQVRVCFISKHN
jgi:hypothetical protein